MPIYGVRGPDPRNTVVTAPTRDEAVDSADMFYADSLGRAGTASSAGG